MKQGCQFLVDKIYQNGGKYTKLAPNYQMAIKYTKWPNNIPNGHKIYQMAIKYTNWTLNIPNGQNIYQHLSLQDNPKFTQSWIFGLKLYHLATLI
jgi:hypothetical protein